MRILFLGTSGSVPTAERGSPCVALRRNGELIFFDCGEGTQRQLASAGLRYGKLSKILITHLHGDHVLGLGGILQTLTLSRRARPLYLFGPPGLGEFVEALRRTLQFSPTFSIVINEIESQRQVFENSQYVIRSCMTDHDDITSLAYLFEEKKRPGRFFPDKAKQLGVSEGPLWRKLQLGEVVRLTNGTVIKPEMVLGPERPGRKMVYSGDTRPTKDLVSFSSNANVLIHDSTYDDSLVDKAAEYGHSTASQAAETAKEANVKLLVLTHISNRYRNDNLLLEQARRIFPNTVVATDFFEIIVSPDEGF